MAYSASVTENNRSRDNTLTENRERKTEMVSKKQRRRTMSYIISPFEVFFFLIK